MCVIRIWVCSLKYEFHVSVFFMDIILLSLLENIDPVGLKMHSFNLSGKYLNLCILIFCQNNGLISELCGTGYFI